MSAMHACFVEIHKRRNNVLTLRPCPGCQHPTTNGIPPATQQLLQRRRERKGKGTTNGARACRCHRYEFSQSCMVVSKCEHFEWCKRLAGELRQELLALNGKELRQRAAAVRNLILSLVPRVHLFHALCAHVI